MSLPNQRDAQIWEDGLRTNPKKKSFEWWYFDSSFTDGSTLVVTFFTKQAQDAAGPMAPSIQIVYTTPKGEKKSFTQSYSPKEFEASVEKCDVVMGKNKVSGNLKLYKLHLDVPGFSGDLEFKRVAPSYSTTEHRNAKPSAFGWFPSIPYGTVSGEITFEDKKIKLSGTGYHDHNWGSMNMNDIIRYWYWGRGRAGDYSIVFSVMYLPWFLGGRQASILYLAKGDKILIGESNKLKLTKSSLKPPTPSISRLPTKLTFTNTDEFGTVEFTLTNTAMIESTDPFQGQPRWKFFLSHLFSKPHYVRYNADLELEVNVGDQKEKVVGKGLYEIMILR